MPRQGTCPGRSAARERCAARPGTPLQAGSRISGAPLRHRFVPRRIRGTQRISFAHTSPLGRESPCFSPPPFAPIRPAGKSDRGGAERVAGLSSPALSRALLRFWPASRLRRHCPTPRSPRLIRTVPSSSSCHSRPAAPSTCSRACWHHAWAKCSASRCWSRTSPARPASSARATSPTQRRMATPCCSPASAPTATTRRSTRSSPTIRSAISRRSGWSPSSRWCWSRARICRSRTSRTSSPM